MKICAALHQGPSSAGMARHLAPFWWRHRMAERVRRRSCGGVLPFGRHASIRGSRRAHCPSLSIAPPHLGGAKRKSIRSVQATTRPSGHFITLVVKIGAAIDNIELGNGKFLRLEYSSLPCLLLNMIRMK